MQVNDIIISTNTAVDNSVTLPIVGTIRESCCSNPGELTLVLLSNGSSGSSVSLRVKKS